MAGLAAPTQLGVDDRLGWLGARSHGHPRAPALRVVP